MQCVILLYNKHKITNLTQTFNRPINICSFMYHGETYYGEGRPLRAIHRILTKQGYQWTFFTRYGKQLFIILTSNANERLDKYKLSKYMRHIVN